MKRFHYAKGKSFGIIPARSGSKGIPDKNISLILGHPLMAYSVAVAKQCPSLSKVIVSTDSERYADVARNYGAEVPFLRPAELAQSSSTDLEYLQHALFWMEDHWGEVPEYIVLLRPTTPVRTPECVERAIELMKATESVSAVVSVHSIEECPYKWMIIGETGYLKSPFSELEPDDVNLPRQQFPKMYFPNGYVDILKSRNIIEAGCLYGECAFPYVIEEPVIDIDTPDDLATAGKAMGKLHYERLFD